MIKCLWRLFSTSDIRGIMLDPRHTMHVTSEDMDWEEKIKQEKSAIISVCEDETEALCDAGMLGLSIKTMMIRKRVLEEG